MPTDAPIPSQAPLFSPLVERAAELAAQWHEGTYRKATWREPAFALPVGERPRVPVMAHVTAVAMTLQRAGWPEEVVAAAFLHDVLEDENRHDDRMERDAFRRLVGPEVAALVEGVTEQKYAADGSRRGWLERKGDYVEQLRRGPVEAVAISLADKLHNMWSMNQGLRCRVDVFTTEGDRVGLSAGPEQQQWYYYAVLDAARERGDARLAPLIRRLEKETIRFESHCGLAPREGEAFGDGTCDGTVLFVMGVSGSGKTTAGRKLAGALGWLFYEGDTFHPPENVQRMTGGEPLDDEARAPWLSALADLAGQVQAHGRCAVIACSALKASYREALRRGDARVRFVYLEIDRDLVRRRLEERRGHFMPVTLVDSQFEALEVPADAITVSAAEAPDEIVRQVREQLGA